MSPEPTCPNKWTSQSKNTTETVHKKILGSRNAIFWSLVKPKMEQNKVPRYVAEEVEKNQKEKKKERQKEKPRLANLKPITFLQSMNHLRGVFPRASWIFFL